MHNLKKASWDERDALNKVEPPSKAVYNVASGDFVGSPTFTNTVTFEPIAHPTHAEGQVYYDSTHKTLSYQGDIDGVEHEIGIEEHVRVYNYQCPLAALGKGQGEEYRSYS